MSEFAANHKECKGALHLEGALETVFPLFGAVREAEWAEGWQINVMHATTPLLEEAGAVFTTHLHGDHPTIWVVTKFDHAMYRIQYARITPEVQAVLIDITCEADSANTTRA